MILVVWFTNMFINMLLESHHCPRGGIISLILEMRELRLKRLTLLLKVVQQNSGRAGTRTQDFTATSKSPVLSRD